MSGKALQRIILMLVFAIIMFVVLFGLDAYVFKSFYSLVSDKPKNIKWIVGGVYWGISILSAVLLLMMMRNFQDWRVNRPYVIMFAMALFFVFFIPKLIVGAFHLIDDIRYGITWIIREIKGGEYGGKSTGQKINRITFITKSGQIIGGLVLAGLLYGVTKGKYAFRVLSHKLAFDNLPKSFDGLRIVQISDLHLGSFAKDYEDVMKGVQMVNDLDPDYIFFTGDLVNSISDEAEPWIPIFSKMKAKKGIYSILGNHDYADYGEMTKEERARSFKRLQEIHGEMGFQLMMNENVMLREGNDEIALVGVENWGPGFKVAGDLPKALKGTENAPFKILLSHDPTHWEQEVFGKENIDLTLSGHTHGAQMGVELPKLGIKFSPVSVRYKRWGGMYQEGKQYLHVNRGFGFLGFPGRAGMAPEITLIELSSKA